VKFLRRAFSALFLGVLFATGLRVGGVTGAPRQHGGWRPLELPDPEPADA